MAGKQRTNRTAGGAKTNHNPEEGTMGLDAKPLCDQGRNGGEEAPVGHTVYDGKKIQHPRLVGKLQPTKTD